MPRGCVTRRNGSRLIAIAGGSGAGKSWLAARLERLLAGRVARLSLDDFYRDRSHLTPGRRARLNFDHPRAIDWPALRGALRDCRAGRRTQTPRYDFSTHTRRPEREDCEPKAVVLVEGLWLLWPPFVRRLFHARIYLDCPESLRLQRRLARDMGERGRTAASVRRQFAETVAPMHARFVAPQARRADIVLRQPYQQGEIERLAGVLWSALSVRSGSSDSFRTRLTALLLAASPQP